MTSSKGALLIAAINCGHHIECEKITLEFDAGRSGKNALNQLSVRLEAALETCTAAHLARIAALEAENADLLEVLRELQESASYWSEYDVPVGIVDRINAAIAKATGEKA